MYLTVNDFCQICLVIIGASGLIVALISLISIGLTLKRYSTLETVCAKSSQSLPTSTPNAVFVFRAH